MMKALHPRYWIYYLAAAFGCLFVQLLPYRLALLIGRLLGRLFQKCSKRRHLIAMRNIQRCFPDWLPQRHTKTIDACFESVGMGFVEVLLVAWWPQWRLNKLTLKISGEEYLEGEQGALLCGAHFSPMEMVGFLFGKKHPNLQLVYQRHKDPIINSLINFGRRRYVKGLIPRKQVRGMIRALRQKDNLWYAPDQDLNRQVSVFVPFFGIPCATVKSTGSLVKVGNAKWIMTFFYRLPNATGYCMNLKVLDALPTGNEEQDARLYNQALEQAILEHPEQYLWLHRRFKTRPLGEGSFYDS